MPFKKLRNKLWWKTRKFLDKELKREISSAKTSEKSDRRTLQNRKDIIINFVNNLRGIGLSSSEINVIEQNTKLLVYRQKKPEFDIKGNAAKILSRFTVEQKDKILYSVWVLHSIKKSIPGLESRISEHHQERLATLSELRKRRGKKALR